jgi:hypothetical protein
MTQCAKLEQSMRTLACSSREAPDPSLELTVNSELRCLSPARSALWAARREAARFGEKQVFRRTSLGRHQNGMVTLPGC